MISLPYLAASRPDRDAADLLHHHGDDAPAAARRRAAASRRLGNYVHFCRWREVERLLTALADGRGDATLH